MSLVIGCPSCQGKLRIADDLRGQRVRCPTCDHTFDAPGLPAPPPQPSPAPRDFPLDLSLDAPDSSASTASSGDADGLFGAMELKPLGSDQPPAPPTPDSVPKRTPPRLRDEDEFDEDAPSFARRQPPRRDCEPDRGSVVLTLGILSLVGLCISPVGLVLGLVAWVMGQKDLRKMRRGDMDPRGEGSTQAGWICGIIGTVLNGLMTLLCTGYIATVIIVVNSVTPPAPPVGPSRPIPPTVAPPVPPKQPMQPKPKAQPGPDW
jgi:predicted Zn finger-like uncharacterized protein